MQRVLLRRLGPLVAVVALSSAFAIGVARTGWVRAIENIYYDAWHLLAGVRYAPAHTLLVTVDDETLLALKDEPLAFWSPHFARAMEVLARAGARVIGLDFLYQVSAEAWLARLRLPDHAASRTYDAALRAALAAGDKVLITHLVELKNGELELVLPPADQLVLLPRGMGDLGVANLPTDEDKHVRHFHAFFDPDPRSPGAALGTQLALRAADQDPFATRWDLPGSTLTRGVERRLIRYAGPPGTIPTLSMHALLQPDALANPAVRNAQGKVVIISADNVSNPDRHFTPYSRGADTRQMAGGEIHANIVETLLAQATLARLPPLPEQGYVVLLGLLAAALFMNLGLGASSVSAAVLVLLAPLPALIAFRADLVLPVAAPQLGIAAAFLLALGLKFTRAERERRRIRNLFGRYVAEDVVAKILSDEDRPDLAGESATVTLLFSDIRNFTTLSEKLTAHEVVEMLNAHFTRACNEILRQGGTVDKYIGDAVMAVFGSPVAHPDHARRALRAALGMAREAEAFRAWMAVRFAGRGLPEFGIGVGMHTGTAVIGDIGSPRRKEFTAIGDVVNTASRLEGATKALECVIAASAATVHAAGAGVRVGKAQAIQVKGKADPIQVFEIVGLDDPVRV